MLGMEAFSARPPAFPTGTSMVFQQTAAPTGWTKQTTHNDKAMRLVTGTPSSGGSVAFSTVFGKTATDNYTLVSPTDIPAHSHSVLSRNNATAFGANARATLGNTAGTTTNDILTNLTGSDGAHNHPMDIRVNYVDFIIANKD